MANKTRKDSKGRALRKGENQRKDGRYSYSWTNSRGERKVIYSKDLLELRRKEKKLIEDLEDGLDPNSAEKITVNQYWNKYIKNKHDLKETTKSNYKYTYDHFVRDALGKMKLGAVKYSHVRDFYYGLMEEDDIAVATIDNIHTLLHPLFERAIRDELIRTNPTNGLMNEIKRGNADWKGHRRALTIPQQQALVDFIEDNVEYEGWYPILVTLLGTGMRIGECLGLRWEDVDFKKRSISVNHNLIYRPVENEETGERITKFTVTTPKTRAGIRTIPLFNDVYDAFAREYQLQKCLGFNQSEIDGFSGFIFTNGKGTVFEPGAVNKAIKRITESYNALEEELAKAEDREAVMLPDFSCHHLRHTFCTRLCETDTNIKVIQSIMGHADIQTTMDIYAEVTQEKKEEVLHSLEGKLIIK